MLLSYVLSAYNYVRYPLGTCRDLSKSGQLTLAYLIIRASEASTSPTSSSVPQWRTAVSPSSSPACGSLPAATPSVPRLSARTVDSGSWVSLPSFALDRMGADVVFSVVWYHPMAKLRHCHCLRGEHEHARSGPRHLALWLVYRHLPLLGRLDSGFARPVRFGFSFLERFWAAETIFSSRCGLFFLLTITFLLLFIFYLLGGKSILQAGGIFGSYFSFCFIFGTITDSCAPPSSCCCYTGLLTAFVAFYLGLAGMLTHSVRSLKPESS